MYISVKYIIHIHIYICMYVIYVYIAAHLNRKELKEALSIYIKQVADVC